MNLCQIYMRCSININYLNYYYQMFKEINNNNFIDSISVEGRKFGIMWPKPVQGIEKLLSQNLDLNTLGDPLLPKDIQGRRKAGLQL